MTDIFTIVFQYNITPKIRLLCKSILNYYDKIFNYKVTNDVIQYCIQNRYWDSIIYLLSNGDISELEIYKIKLPEFDDEIRLLIDRLAVIFTQDQMYELAEGFNQYEKLGETTIDKNGNKSTRILPIREHLKYVLKKGYLDFKHREKDDWYGERYRIFNIHYSSKYLRRSLAQLHLSKKEIEDLYIADDETDQICDLGHLLNEGLRYWDEIWSDDEDHSDKCIYNLCNNISNLAQILSENMRGHANNYKEHLKPEDIPQSLHKVEDTDMKDI